MRNIIYRSEIQINAYLVWSPQNVYIDIYKIIEGTDPPTFPYKARTTNHYLTPILKDCSLAPTSEESTDRLCRSQIKSPYPSEHSYQATLGTAGNSPFFFGKHYVILSKIQGVLFCLYIYVYLVAKNRIMVL